MKIVKRMIQRLQLLRDQARRFLGILFFDKKSPERNLKEVEHILVIRWDAKLGDSYISSFFFREVKKRKNIKVSVLTTAELESLYVDTFGVDNVIKVNKRPNYKELRNVAESLKGVDFVIHLTEYMKMKDLYFLAKLNPKNVASMDDAIGRVNIKMAAETQGKTFHYKYYYLLQLLNISDINDSYIIPDVQVEQTEGYIDLLCNFFGSTEHKSISNQRAIDALKVVTNKFPFLKVGLLSSPDTKSKAEQIAAEVGNKNVYVLDNIQTINNAIAAVKRSQLVFTVDTSIVHIAMGLKKPTIAVYPKKGNRFNPWLPPESNNTSILFSFCAGVNVDVNNFSSEELILELERYYPKLFN